VSRNLGLPTHGRKKDSSPHSELQNGGLIRA
jgi:hypothetical protein